MASSVSKFIQYGKSKMFKRLWLYKKYPVKNQEAGLEEKLP